MPHNRDTASNMLDKLSGIVEEKDLYDGFAPHVEASEIKMLDSSNMSKQTGEFLLLQVKKKCQNNCDLELK